MKVLLTHMKLCQADKLCRYPHCCMSQQIFICWRHCRCRDCFLFGPFFKMWCLKTCNIPNGKHIVYILVFFHIMHQVKVCCVVCDGRSFKKLVQDSAYCSAVVCSEVTDLFDLVSQTLFLIFWTIQHCVVNHLVCDSDSTMNYVSMVIWK